MNSIERTASAATFGLLIGLVLFGVLATNVWSAEDVSSAEITALIEQLGDPDFVERERAQAKLGEMGEKAYDALTTAAHNSDLEIAARARYLLLTIKLPAVRETDSERVKETLEGYENLPRAAQLQVVEQLMRLPQGEGYRAACRLVHIENSVAMSKSIATTLLIHWPIHAEGRQRMRDAVAAELTRSGRKVAKWLTTYANLDAAPETNIEAWRQIVDAEVKLLEERSPRTTAAVVASLLYDRAYWESECDEASGLAQDQFERAQAVALKSLRVDGVSLPRLGNLLSESRKNRLGSNSLFASIDARNPPGDSSGSTWDG